jgi:prepilin-type N-terminal cleavage/methylation domain-containing protein
MTPKFKSSHRLSKPGFTMVELLVVVVIIIVLVSIGIPVMNNARASASRTQCLNQLRGWGVAFGGFAADNDGKIEWRKWPSISWNEEQCSPYVHYWTGSSVNFEERNDNGAFRLQLDMRNCPGVKWDPARGNSPVTYATIRPVGASGDPYSLARIRNPGRFMLMTESTPSSSNFSLASSADFTSRVKPITQNGPNLRHTKGTVNAVMADFSAKQMTWGDIEKGLAYWNVF